MEATEFYEKFKKDKGLNFCEGLDDVFELMTEYSNYKLSEANEKLKEISQKWLECDDETSFTQYLNELLKP